MHLRVGYTNQKKRLRNFEIEQIVTIFRERKPVDNFSVCVYRMTILGKKAISSPQVSISTSK